MKPQSKARLTGILLTALIAAGLTALWLGLRQAGYDPRFVVEHGEALIPNPKFSWQFFPRRMAREPVPFRLPTPKKDPCLRIAILGESVSAGFPDTAFGFGRILRVMIERASPGSAVEILNASTVAINSHVAVPLAREMIQSDVDAIIVYLGNTEVIGPYGAGTRLTAQGSSLPAIRLRMALAATPLGQLRRTVSEKTAAGGRASTWGGMAMVSGMPVPEKSREMETTRRHFRGNLETIAAVAAGADIPVILCTVPVNLADCAPFGDETGGRGPAENPAYAEGIAYETAMDFDLAAQAYRRAMPAYARSSELHYRLATCLAELGDAANARRHYLRARDLDTLRFRTDASLNTIVRTAAEKHAHLHLADAEKALEAAALSASGLPGHDFFHEHAHLNFDGHYEVAEAIFHAMRTSGLVPAGAGAASRTECAEALAFTPWHAYHGANIIRDILQEAPCSSKPDADRLLRLQESRLDTLRASLTRDALADALARMEAAAAKRPEDILLLHSLARIYADLGNYAQSAEYWMRAAALQPLSAGTHHNLGTALARLGRHAEAVEALSKAIALNPLDSRYHSNLGSELFMLNRLTEAETALKKAHRLDPDSAAILNNLGGVLAAGGRTGRAIRTYRQALALDPDFAQTHNNLGAALENAGQTDRAVESYRQALALHPEYIEAHQNLARLYQKQNDPAAAIPHYAGVARLRPDDPHARYNYAVVLAGAGHIDAAIREIVAALRIEPDWEPARQALKQLAQAKTERRPAVNPTRLPAASESGPPGIPPGGDRR